MQLRTFNCDVSEAAAAGGADEAAGGAAEGDGRPEEGGCREEARREAWRHGTKTQEFERRVSTSVRNELQKQLASDTDDQEQES